MVTSKWFYITIIIIGLVTEVLGFAGFVVWFTGTTDGLVAIGQMVALIVGAFFG
jgi:hypothetical protein